MPSMSISSPISLACASATRVAAAGPGLLGAKDLRIDFDRLAVLNQVLAAEPEGPVLVADHAAPARLARIGRLEELFPGLRLLVEHHQIPLAANGHAAVHVLAVGGDGVHVAVALVAAHGAEVQELAGVRVEPGDVTPPRSQVEAARRIFGEALDAKIVVLADRAARSRLAGRQVVFQQARRSRLAEVDLAVAVAVRAVGPGAADHAVDDPGLAAVEVQIVDQERRVVLHAAVGFERHDQVPRSVVRGLDQTADRGAAGLDRHSQVLNLQVLPHRRRCGKG